MAPWICAHHYTHTQTHTQGLRVSLAPLASSWAFLWSDLISFRSACSLLAWTQRGSSINLLAVFFSVISCSRAAAGPFLPKSVCLTTLPAEQVARWTSYWLIQHEAKANPHGQLRQITAIKPYGEIFDPNIVVLKANIQLFKGWLVAQGLLCLCAFFLNHRMIQIILLLFYLCLWLETAWK